mmetsp:Transcript_22698/g.37523  ORF Transcript_22698/g.37523 Transcript_22698/m.37523 type:complete len:715 (-) Transcript_22698:179-2323(-)
MCCCNVLAIVVQLLGLLGWLQYRLFGESQTVVPVRTHDNLCPSEGSCSAPYEQVRLVIRRDWFAPLFSNIVTVLLDVLSKQVQEMIDTALPFSVDGAIQIGDMHANLEVVIRQQHAPQIRVANTVVDFLESINSVRFGFERVSLDFQEIGGSVTVSPKDDEPTFIGLTVSATVAVSLSLAISLELSPAGPPRLIVPSCYSNVVVEGLSVVNNVSSDNFIISTAISALPGVVEGALKALVENAGAACSVIQSTTQMANEFIAQYGFNNSALLRLPLAVLASTKSWGKIPFLQQISIVPPVLQEIFSHMAFGFSDGIDRVAIEALVTFFNVTNQSATAAVRIEAVPSEPAVTSDDHAVPHCCWGTALNHALSELGFVLQLGMSPFVRSLNLLWRKGFFWCTISSEVLHSFAALMLDAVSSFSKTTGGVIDVPLPVDQLPSALRRFVPQTITFNATECVIHVPLPVDQLPYFVRGYLPPTITLNVTHFLLSVFSLSSEQLSTAGLGLVLPELLTDYSTPRPLVLNISLRQPPILDVDATVGVQIGTDIMLDVLVDEGEHADGDRFTDIMSYAFSFGSIVVPLDRSLPGESIVLAVKIKQLQVSTQPISSSYSTKANNVAGVVHLFVKPLSVLLAVGGMLADEVTIPILSIPASFSLKSFFESFKNVSGPAANMIPNFDAELQFTLRESSISLGDGFISLGGTSELSLPMSSSFNATT